MVNCRSRLNDEHVCYFCSLYFKTMNSLQIHLLTHTKELPFKLLSCQYGSTQLYSVKMHVKEVHKLANVKILSKCISTVLSPHVLNCRVRIERFEDGGTGQSDMPRNPYPQHKGNYKSKGISVKTAKVGKPITEKSSIKTNTSSRIPIKIRGIYSTFDFGSVENWFQCKICQVCIKDKRQFINHKNEKHPGWKKARRLEKRRQLMKKLMEMESSDSGSESDMDISCTSDASTEILNQLQNYGVKDRKRQGGSCSSDAGSCSSDLSVVSKDDAEKAVESVSVLGEDI